jgi:hypothetical protein
MKWLALLVTYLPVVLSGVTSIEVASKGLPGTTKKQIVLDIIQAGADTAEKIPQETVAGIGSLIDAVVGILNKSGVFTKAAA